MSKHDPYAALRFKEFNYFLLIRFLLVLAWSHAIYNNRMGGL